MAALSENGYVFSETQIINFQSAEWSKKMLGLYYPLCKSFDESKSISEQRIDHLGNGRYWNRVFRFGNHQFLITSEWYKQSRPLFIKWFNSLSCTNE